MLHRSVWLQMSSQKCRKTLLLRVGFCFMAEALTLRLVHESVLSFHHLFFCSIRRMKSCFITVLFFTSSEAGCKC
nr:Uncharacterised protein [Klebsiella pneumoniae]